MAITNQLPVAGSFIDPDTTVGFDIDDTYTTMRIEVSASGGVQIAWDSSLGGQQTGYQFSVTDNGDGTESWTILPDAGWDVDPQTITVFENESGADVETELSWLLSGTVVYPNSDKPYYSELGAGFKVTEDNVGIVVNVTHLDFVAGSEDGITVTDLGGGKVRLTARATTNDPDAIHVDVASEIQGLTEKTSPAGDDLVIVEDSADSWAKKGVTRQNMGGSRAPSKLENDLDCIMLYTFEGVLTDAIASGQTLSTTVGANQFYGAGVVPETQGLFLEESWGVKSTPATLATSKYPHGDFTAQVVFFPGRTVDENGATDSNLFKLRNDDTNQTVFQLGFPASGSVMEPGCWYTDTSPTNTETTGTNGVIGDGTPCHMVQRVYDAGGGLYTQELWVNNSLISSDTGLAAPLAWDATDLYYICVGKDDSVANSGLCRGVVESVKLSNRKLTDAEIGDEFRKALGYPAI